MSNSGFQRRKGVSPWMPVGFLFWTILMLTIFFAFFLAGGNGLAGLSLTDALIYVLLRMAFIALFFSPLFLAGIIVWLGYKFLIKKKLQVIANQADETSPASKDSK